MHWSFSPDIPIYIQIIEQLEQMIVSGMLSPGDRLLSVREFAAEAGGKSQHHAEGSYGA